MAVSNFKVSTAYREGNRKLLGAVIRRHPPPPPRKGVLIYVTHTIRFASKLSLYTATTPYNERLTRQHHLSSNELEPTRRRRRRRSHNESRYDESAALRCARKFLRLIEFLKRFIVLEDATA